MGHALMNKLFIFAMVRQYENHKYLDNKLTNQTILFFFLNFHLLYAAFIPKSKVIVY